MCFIYTASIHAVPIVALQPQAGIRAHALAAGADAFVLKARLSTDLLSAIRQLARGGW